MTTNKQFAKALREARLAASLTQAQAAEKINVRPQTVSMWEMAHNQPLPAQRTRLDALFPNLPKNDEVLETLLPKFKAKLDAERAEEKAERKERRRGARPRSPANVKWGEALRALLVKYGIDEADLAVKLLMSETAIKRWSSKGLIPSKQTYGKLCDIYPEMRGLLDPEKLANMTPPSWGKLAKKAERKERRRAKLQVGVASVGGAHPPVVAPRVTRHNMNGASDTFAFARALMVVMALPESARWAIHDLLSAADDAHVPSDALASLLSSSPPIAAARQDSLLGTGAARHRSAR